MLSTGFCIPKYIHTYIVCVCVCVCVCCVCVRIYEWDMRKYHISELYVTSALKREKGKGPLDLFRSGVFCLWENKTKIAKDNIAENEQACP